MPRVWSSQRESQKHRKKSTNVNSSDNSDPIFFLSYFGWVPDSCHSEAGRGSRELSETVRVNAFVFGVSGFWVGVSASRKWRGGGVSGRWISSRIP